MKKLIIIIVTLVFFQMENNAQQEIILTKYTFNSMFFNPAYAGSNGEVQGTATLQYRNQWLGVNGAPTTLLGGAEYSFFSNSLGVGATIGQEGIGSNTNTEFSINTAYRMRLGDGFLSGGIRAGYTYISSNFLSLDVLNPGDIFDDGSEKLSLFSVGAGVLYHDNQFKIGFSIPTIVSIGEGSIEKSKHIYAHFSILIGDEYSTIKWKPNMLVKYEHAVPLQLTLGMQAWLNDRIAPGIHWRLGESLAVSIEMKFMEDFSFTAAYDFTTNDLHDYTSGSMEVMLGYKFGENDRN
jgi:type IX secretion system PorP/SprF family membrane protein